MSLFLCFANGMVECDGGQCRRAREVMSDRVIDSSIRPDEWVTTKQLAVDGYRRKEPRDRDIETAVLTFGLDRAQQIEALVVGDSKMQPADKVNRIRDSINELLLTSLFTAREPDGTRYVNPVAVKMMEDEGYLGKAGKRWGDKNKKRGASDKPSSSPLSRR